MTIIKSVYVWIKNDKWKNDKGTRERAVKKILKNG